MEKREGKNGEKWAWYNDLTSDRIEILDTNYLVNKRDREIGDT